MKRKKPIRTRLLSKHEILLDALCSLTVRADMLIEQGKQILARLDEKQELPERDEPVTLSEIRRLLDEIEKKVDALLCDTARPPSPGIMWPEHITVTPAPITLTPIPITPLTRTGK